MGMKLTCILIQLTDHRMEKVTDGLLSFLFGRESERKESVGDEIFFSSIRGYYSTIFLLFLSSILTPKPFFRRDQSLLISHRFWEEKVERDREQREKRGGSRLKGEVNTTPKNVKRMERVEKSLGKEQREND